MSLSTQCDFLSNVNRMFDNLSLNKEYIDEAQREKFVNRALSLKDIGLDITESSKITGSFLREFFNVSTKSAIPTHEERLAALSERYAQMRDELTEMFKDNEDEFYRQMGRLNEAFKQALESTCLTPIYSYKTVEVRMFAFTEGQEAERIRFEKESAEIYAAYERYNRNVQNVMKNFRDNLLRHVNKFFENFIKSIQTNDYDTAYQESMALLKTSETTSYNEISYTDMVRIMDIINNVPTEFDEKGAPTKMRYNAADESFMALIKDDSVTYSVRKAIAELFGFSIGTEEDGAPNNPVVQTEPSIAKRENANDLAKTYLNIPEIDNENSPAKSQKYPIEIIYINPQGERIKMIVSEKGTRFIRLGNVKNVFE